MYTLEITHIYDYDFKPSKYVNKSLVQDHNGNQILDRRFIYFVYHLYSIASMLDESKIELSPDYKKQLEGSNVEFFRDMYRDQFQLIKNNVKFNKIEIINYFINRFSPMVMTYYISFKDVNILEENLKFFRNIYSVDDNIHALNSVTQDITLEYDNMDGVYINTTIESTPSKFRKPKDVDDKKRLTDRITRLYKKKDEHLFHKTLLDWYCHTILNLTDLQIPIVEKRMFEII